MDFGLLISQAWKIVIKHRFLWIFGMLGGSSAGATSGNVYSAVGEAITSFFGSETSEAVGSMVDRPITSNGLIPDLSGPVQADSSFGDVGLIWFLIVVSLTITGLVVYLSVVFRAALIYSIDALGRDQSVDFWQGFRMGRQYFWPMFGLGLLILGLVLLFTGLVAAPILLLVILESEILAVMVGIILGIVWLLTMFGLVVIGEYAVRIITLEQFRPVESFMAAIRLIKQQPGQSILVWLVAMGLNVAISIVMLIVVGIILVPLGGAGFYIYRNFSLGLSIAYGALVGPFVLVGFTIIAGLIGSFLSAFWTLGYRALKGKLVVNH